MLRNHGGTAHVAGLYRIQPRLPKQYCVSNSLGLTAEQYEFRLGGANNKVAATKQHSCETLDDALLLSRKLIAGYKWIEVWLGSQPLVRMANMEMPNAMPSET